MDIFFPLFIEEAIFSPMRVLGSFVENKMTLAVWVYVWVFYSILLVFMSVFVLVSCCSYYYGYVVKFGVRDCDTSSIGSFASGFPWLFKIF
jgi:hypothetical protein